MFEPVLRLPQTRSRAYIGSVDWVALWGELMPMLAFVLIYMLGAQALELVAHLHFPPATVWLSIWLVIFPWLIIPALLIALIHARLSVRNVEGLRIDGWPGWVAGYRKARVGPLSPTTLVRLVAVLVVFPAYHRAYSIYKSAIPLVLPFRYDSQWTEIDRWIHFGRLPYQLLPSALTTPLALHWFEVLYLSWHVVVGCVVLWVTMQSDARLRRRFYFVFLAILVLLGNVAALAGSSAGPCYYALVTGQPDVYPGLMQQLAQASGSIPYTLAIQWELWHHYQLSTVGVGTGISAMPSVHVALPVLFALAAYQKDAALGIALGFFGVAIFIGSIALGWHYAVDGYASIVGVSILWWASGRIAVRR